MKADIRGAKDMEEVRASFIEYEKELGISLSFQQYEEELAVLQGKYKRPTGRLFLIYEDGKLVGCGALRHHAKNFVNLNAFILERRM